MEHALNEETKSVVLYVEDDENDAYLVQHAFEKAKFNGIVQVASGGAEAIQYLTRCGRAEESRLQPEIVLLDLNMPGVSGLELLKWIRTTPGFTTLPVLILSSSNQPSDIESALLQGANSYLVKPGSFDELMILVKAIKDFWLDLSCNRSSTCVQNEKIADTEVCAR